VSPDLARDGGAPRAGRLLRARRRESAPALRAHPRALARPLRGATRRGRAAVQRAVRPHLAPLPGRSHRRPPRRIAPAPPGRVRTRAIQRGAVDARRSLPPVSERRWPIVGVMGSGVERHDALAAPLGRWIARRGCHLLTGGGGGVMAAVSEAFASVAERPGLVIGVLKGFPGDGGRVGSATPNPRVEVPSRVPRALARAHAT